MQQGRVPAVFFAVFYELCACVARACPSGCEPVKKASPRLDKRVSTRRTHTRAQDSQQTMSLTNASEHTQIACLSCGSTSERTWQGKGPNKYCRNRACKELGVQRGHITPQTRKRSRASSAKEEAGQLVIVENIYGSRLCGAVCTPTVRTCGSRSLRARDQTRRWRIFMFVTCCTAFLPRAQKDKSLLRR